MLLFRMAYLSCKTKTSPLVSIFSKNAATPLFFRTKNFNSLSRSCILAPVMFNARTQLKNHVSMARKATNFSTICAEALVQSRPVEMRTRKSRKRARYESPENVLRGKLDACSKNGDLTEALRLYNEARVNNVELKVQHYNVLLYLCSAQKVNDDAGEFVGLEKGFEIFEQMRIDNVAPNEATFTNASRLAALKRDPELAFDMIKKMKDHGIVPRLRSYGPALSGFCEKGMADKAYEVDLHMVENGVGCEEVELAALLRVSSKVGREGKVYEMMHRLRTTVRQVSEETAVTIEDWFRSTRAAEVGIENWDVSAVKKGVLDGGGGWHGQGWLGKGSWRVSRTNMDNEGVCQACGEKLVSIDIDPNETEKFAESLAKLVCQKEPRNDFVRFQDWLQRHGPFEAVVDGANIGLANNPHVLNFAHIRRVVDQCRQISASNKLPLVILHHARVSGGPAQHPNNKRLLESWKRARMLYATPQGPNDDWYWLYAAVSCNSLLVTNDEMRDHLFSLLGNSFFPRWKEKHQVRLTLLDDGYGLKMPPPYSSVIQESEQGSWHIPTVTGDDLDTPRQWVCATRARST